MKRTALKRIGKKGRRNLEALQVQTPAFDQAGIQWCELRRHFSCTGSWALHLAHTKPRNQCSDDDLTYLVARLCDTCHFQADRVLRDQERIILQIILSREASGEFFDKARELAAQRLEQLNDVNSRSTGVSKADMDQMEADSGEGGS